MAKLIMLNLFKRKDKTTNITNNYEKFQLTFLKNKRTHPSILNYFGFNNFNYQTYFTNFIAENNDTYIIIR